MLADGTAITGVELKKLSDDELRSRVGKIILFARTDPIQKLRIVEALRANGEVIAMTGDGVNDSPALKSADIGIVVKDASDISKEVADMVLLDSNFGTIVRAVEEGRAMFDNIKKTVMYLLIGSFSELILVMGAILLQLPLPITALQILWVNLVEDALPALSLAFEPKEGDLLKQPPRSKNEHILDRQMLKIIALFVLIADAMIFLIFYYLHRESVSVELMRTVVFVGVGINSLFYIFACKSLRHTIFSYNPFSNRFMVLSVLIGIGALIVGVQMPIFNLVLGTVPLSLGYWTSLFGLGLLNLLLFEVIKVWVNRGNRSTEMQLR
ncbi:MAG: HAD-IC family P-type ATPase [Candidatus Dojkabacteria bacterium]|nr:MAG: HAD-IC family P-type ATPase [Candidatus Dojkabacteria bacterium]